MHIAGYMVYLTTVAKGKQAVFEQPGWGSAFGGQVYGCWLCISGEIAGYSIKNTFHGMETGSGGTEEEVGVWHG